MDPQQRQRLFDEYRRKCTHPLLKVSEAAALVGVKPSTIHGWSHQGLLNDCKQGRGKGLRLISDCFIDFFLSR